MARITVEKDESALTSSTQLDLPADLCGLLKSLRLIKHRSLKVKRHKRGYLGSASHDSQQDWFVMEDRPNAQGGGRPNITPIRNEKQRRRGLSEERTASGME